MQPRGHNTQVGQVKLQARLGAQGHDVAFRQPQRAQPGRNLLGRQLPGVPRTDRVVVPARHGLAQSGRIAISRGGVFENLE